MQHKQENYKAWVYGGLLCAVGLFAGQVAYSAGIADRNAPDPILSGGLAGPCDPAKAGADYVPGTDVNGNPVAPADLAGPPVPVPGRVEIPLKSGAYVSADGKALAPLLNPPPACAARR